LYIAHDRTLQSIVFKLVANLERNELERQIKFYDKEKLDYPAQLKEKLEQFNLLNRKNQLKANGLCFQSEAEREKEDENDKENKKHNYHRDDEPIALSLEPLDGLQVLCSYLTTIDFF
jgi:polycomb group RING finger protein 3